MRAGDESFERLRAALEQLATDDVAELVAEARAEARSRVRTMLTEAMAQTMLERAHEQLEAASSPEAVAPAQVPAPTRPPHAPEPGRPPRAPEPSPRAGAPAQPEHGLGWYVYCVTAADGPTLPELSGIDPAHPVTALRDGELAAIVSPVALARLRRGPAA